MDMERVRTFVDVVRRGSFAAVARDRNVDASSVSRAIATLEGELDVQLFLRTTRRLSLTEAGMAYLDRVEPLLDAFDEAGMIARDAGRQPEGNLRITALVGFAHENIIPLLPELTARYPKLSFEMILNDQPLDLVAERIDVAIRLGPISDSSFRTFKLASATYIVCASPEYIARNGPIERPSDLADRRCILFPQAGYRSGWTFRDSNGDEETVAVSPLATISNAVSVRRCILDGMGPALMPRWIIGRNLASGELVDLFPDYQVAGAGFDVAAWVLYPAASYIPLKTRVFLDFLKEKFKKGAPGEVGPW